MHPDSGLMSSLFEIRTAAYQPPFDSRILSYEQGLPMFTLRTVTLMLRDPQVRLGTGISMAPLLLPKIVLSGDPDVQELVRKTIFDVWTRAIPDILQGMWYSVSGGELVYTRHPTTGQIHFREFRPIYPLDLTLLYEKGLVLGLRVRPGGLANHLGATGTESDLAGNAVTLWGPKAFLYIHNRRWNSWVGESELLGCYDPWLEKNNWKGARHSRKLWFYKNAFGGGLIFHPPGDYEERAPDGSITRIPYRDLARQAIAQAENGAVWAFEYKVHPETKDLMWRIEPPHINDNASGLIQYVNELDVEIMRGLGIPDDVVQQVGGTGSYAGRTIPLQAFLLSRTNHLRVVFDTVREQIVDPLVRMNFGRGAESRYDVESVTVDTESLMPTLPSQKNPEGPEGPVERADFSEGGIIRIGDPGPSIEANGRQFSRDGNPVIVPTGVDDRLPLYSGVGKFASRDRTRVRKKLKSSGNGPQSFPDQLAFDPENHPRAPKGGMTIGGVTFKGGEFIYKKKLARALKNATPEELERANLLMGQSLREFSRELKRVSPKKDHGPVDDLESLYRLRGRSAISRDEEHHSRRLKEYRAARARVEESNRVFEKNKALPGELSARVPYSTGAVEDFQRDRLLSDFDSLMRNASFASSLSSKVYKMGRMGIYFGLRGLGNRPSARKVFERFISLRTENLIWLYNMFPKELRERAKRWYKGARRIVEMFSGRYGLSDQQVAACIACLSPQNSWFMNVSSAERVMEIWTNHQNTEWSGEMDRVARGVLRKRPGVTLKFIDKNQRLLGQIQGKKLSELKDDLERAWWIRLYDEAHHSPLFRTVTPEGEFGNWAGSPNPKRKSNFLRHAWKSTDAIAKAVRVLRDGSPEVISESLGNNHKVRNFYNNVYSPRSKNPFVTIDTHAVAAAELRLLGGEDPQVSYNFGQSPGKKWTALGVSSPGVDAESGMSGTYGLYAEAFQRAMNEINRRDPGSLDTVSELQSIAWEAIRSLFSEDRKKSKKVRNAVERLWKRYDEGELSSDDLRREIVREVGGFILPNWESGPEGKAVSGVSSSFQGPIPEEARNLRTEAFITGGKSEESP